MGLLSVLRVRKTNVVPKLVYEHIFQTSFEYGDAWKKRFVVLVKFSVFWIAHIFLVRITCHVNNRGDHLWLTSGEFFKPLQISKMELFAKIINCFKLLTIFAKVSVLDVCRGSKYASAHIRNNPFIEQLSFTRMCNTFQQMSKKDKAYNWNL